MCIIIDNNCLSNFMQKPPKEDTKPIHEWLAKSNGTLIYSFDDKFSEINSKKWKKRLLEYDQMGVAESVPFEKWQPALKKLKKENKYNSDDPHILALALAKNTKLLYTNDEKLKSDFKEIIKKGKIYSSQQNKNLLTKDTCKKK